MSRDIVLTSDFIRVRHIMLNVDLDRLKVSSNIQKKQSLGKNSNDNIHKLLRSRTTSNQ
jgi:hypothetical protein